MQLFQVIDDLVFRTVEQTGELLFEDGNGHIEDPLVGTQEGFDELIEAGIDVFVFEEGFPVGDDLCFRRHVYAFAQLPYAFLLNDLDGAVGYGDVELEALYEFIEVEIEIYPSTPPAGA